MGQAVWYAEQDPQVSIYNTSRTAEMVELKSEYSSYLILYEKTILEFFYIHVKKNGNADTYSFFFFLSLYAFFPEGSLRL